MQDPRCICVTYDVRLKVVSVKEKPKTYCECFSRGVNCYYCLFIYLFICVSITTKKIPPMKAREFLVQ